MPGRSYTTDPKVGEFANIIDGFFGTGTVKNVSEDFPAKLGFGNGDFDIVLNKINIGFKLVLRKQRLPNL